MGQRSGLVFNKAIVEYVVENVENGQDTVEKNQYKR